MKKYIKCEECVSFERDKNYKTEGKCKIDGEYTREHRVCNKPAVKIKSQKHL
jgi:hypothetical protein